MTIVAGTGHRPEDCEDENIVRENIRTALASQDTSAVISGMAAGFDLWLADEALDLGIPVWAAKPWTGHTPRRVDESLYAYVIENASKVVNVVPVEEYPGPWCYHRRNEWMVDHATNILAYWSGKERGGTYACIKYANNVGRPIRNIYDWRKNCGCDLIGPHEPMCNYNPEYPRNVEHAAMLSEGYAWSRVAQAYRCQRGCGALVWNTEVHTRNVCLSHEQLTTP